MKGSELTPRGVVPSVEKAARLLDAIASANAALSLAELTRMLAQPKSSVLALCTTLVRSGLLIRLPDGTYRLGTRVLDLARAYLGSIDVTEVFGAACERFPTPGGEGVVLAVLDKTDVVYIACRNSDLPLDINYRIGMRLPAHCSATGKALLSTLPEERVRALYARSKITPLTRNSKRSLRALLDDLGEVRQRGYAIDDEETRQGMVCYGAPVFDWSGKEATAAVAVTTLKHSTDAFARHHLVASVRSVADDLSHRLGAKTRDRAR